MSLPLANAWRPPGLQMSLSLMTAREGKKEEAQLGSASLTLLFFFCFVHYVSPLTLTFYNVPKFIRLETSSALHERQPSSTTSRWSVGRSAPHFLKASGQLFVPSRYLSLSIEDRSGDERWRGELGQCYPPLRGREWTLNIAPPSPSTFALPV